jgi:hypothetical protein
MRIALFLAVLALLPARPAEACTCGSSSTLYFPASGATDVPLDVKILITSSNGMGFRLVGPDDLEVTTTVAEVHGEHELVPDLPLAASSAYKIFLGEVAVSEFVTGSGPAGAPAAPALTAIELAHAPIDPDRASTCLAGGATFLTPTLAAGAEVYVARFDGGPEVLLPAQVFAEAPLVGEGVCSAFPFSAAAGGQGCLSLRARAANGTLSALVERCAPVAECAPTGSNGPTCSPPDDGGCQVSGGASGWLAVLVLAAMRIAAGARKPRARGAGPRAGDRSAG